MITHTRFSSALQRPGVPTRAPDSFESTALAQRHRLDARRAPRKIPAPRVAGGIFNRHLSAGEKLSWRETFCTLMPPPYMFASTKASIRKKNTKVQNALNSCVFWKIYLASRLAWPADWPLRRARRGRSVWPGLLAGQPKKSMRNLNKIMDEID